MKNRFLGYEFDEIKENFIKEGESSYRANQIVEWVYKKGVTSWDKMTNLSNKLRESLKEKWEIASLEFVKTSDSGDGETIKFLWKLHDGKLVESVLIMSEDRRTVCVSSQVGCPAKCAFCASGQKGFFRNLDAGEIVSQVFLINEYLRERNERVSHVVYMGMGEPFRNYDAVVKSIKILNHPNFLNISQRRITVSTVGVVEGINQLAKEGVKVNLVLSLHAPNQKIRQKIIPYARTYPLEDILSAMDAYAESTKRDVTYEYTLIAGINDQEEHAYELVELLKGKQCTVNLIPYNPVIGLRLNRPDHKDIKSFRAILTDARIINTCRYTKGVDIAAACGQLALQEEEMITA